MSTRVKIPRSAIYTRKPTGDRPFTLTLHLDSPRIVVSLRGAFGVGNTNLPQGQRNGAQPGTRRLLTLGGPRARSLLPTVLDTLHHSGFSLARLEEKGGGRFRLPEALGARLALLLWALAPIQKQSRAALVRAGIVGMVDEEVYYWYAKAEGGQPEAGNQRRRNTLKALRILLAGE